MLHHRKRERSDVDDAENTSASGGTAARHGAGPAVTSSNSAANTALQSRSVNITLSDRSCSARPETCKSTAPTPRHAPPRNHSAHAAGRVAKLGGSVAASSHASSANASARNSGSSGGSALSTSTTSARLAHGRARPQPPSSSSAKSLPSGRSGVTSSASTPSARGRGGAVSGASAAPTHARAGGLTASSAAASASALPAGAAEKHGSGNRCSGPTQVIEAERHVRATWRSKRERLESDLKLLTQYTQQLDVDAHAVEDAIEGMLTEFEQEKARIEAHRAATAVRFNGVLQRLRDREDASLAAKQRALDRVRVSEETVLQLRRDQDATEESIVFATDEEEALTEQVRGANAVAAERAAALLLLQQEEERMKDATYGLTGEVKELVVEMERLRKERHRAEVAAMETEVARRELFSLCEGLKGSIRVYCRVKGVAAPPAGATLPASTSARAEDVALTRESTAGAVPDDGSGTHGAGPRCSPQPSRCGSVESASLSAGVRAAAATAAATSVPGRAAFAGAPSAVRRAPAPGRLPSGRSTTRSSVTTPMGAEECDAEAGTDACVFTFPDRVAASAEVGSVPQPSLRHGDRGPLLASTSPALRAAPSPATPSPPLAVAGADDVDVQEGDATGHAAPTSAGKREAVGERGGSAAVADEEVGGLPYGLGRAITIHQTRTNATSTGLSSFTETFTYDRVFTGQARQAEVYRDVEPLVRNAVDGYRVCIFAYGQTGSGKTFTMEGDVAGASPDAYGVTPRALQTVLRRQSELAREGWTYELSCTFVEIYSDNIRDLFQSGSARYEAALQQQQQQQQLGQSGQQSPPPASGCTAGSSVSPSSSSAAYHVIKHSGDRTHITNVVEKKIRSIEEFLQLYKQAVQQRSTAKTDLNDTSSRSHCLFTLHIAGTNATIRQRSDGVLCLIDLAGSERVSDSGVQGKQFKEAVNINRSLLDLGKCIRALRCGAVVPWRNCKLTYLLQNYLGAKGAKLLMIVTVSNARAHAPESLNSLRFAARVQETYIGTSVKRVTNM